MAGSRITTVQGIADSLVASASAAAPGAGAIITSIAAPPAGIYTIKLQVTLSGTAETALANLKITNGATLFTGLPTITGQTFTIEVPHVTLNGTNTLGIVAIAAAVAGSVYSVVIVATRVE